jgi:hypothetical protein
VTGVCDVLNGHLQIYVNGILEADNTNISGTKITDFQEDFFFKAGKWSLGSSTRRFYGDIDELTLWNKALTANEIRSIMCQKLNGNEAGLIGYWRFDENENETVEDLSPNSNDGYIFSESGTAESGTSTTLTDLQKTWSIDEWQNHYLGISAGTGSGQKRTISSNTTNTLTIASAWDTNPDATSKYVISTHDAWVVSGAPLGDESVYDFSTPTTLSLNSAAGDGIALSSISGSPAGVQVYRVDAAPNVSTPPGNLVNLSLSHYFGVFTIGGTSPSYSLTYNYENHPGISDESVLDLAMRSNNTSTNWVETDATLNETNNTLILTGQTGTEYILGSESGDNPLPVTLSSFVATIDNAYPLLSWITESESENMGFIIERRIKGTHTWNKIATYSDEPELEGNGTTSETHSYQFTDISTIAGVIYEYRLSDVNYSGRSNPLEILEISIPQTNTALATQFCLKTAYPNPFNPRTVISIQYPTDCNTLICIYNIQGKMVDQLLNGFVLAGNYDLTWDATTMPSGIYIIKASTENMTQTHKIALMK